MEKEFGPEYASIADASFIVKYRASCYCKVVQIEVWLGQEGTEDCRGRFLREPWQTR